jgi:hypothetical protein
VDAERLVAGAADLAGVVGGEEAADDELPRFDGADVAADLLDDSGVLVSDRGRPVDVLDAAIAPQVQAADAGGGQADDRVGRLLDLRVRAVFDADVAGRVQNCSSHGWLVGTYAAAGCGLASARWSAHRRGRREPARLACRYMVAEQAGTELPMQAMTM